MGNVNPGKIGVKTQTLKGFRDFLPKEAKKRQWLINTLTSVFESYGFEPLETPALEYEETLLGKYGYEGDKLMYRFEDLGKRKVALRYDQTVPLARVVAQYQNDLTMPFKRYQIQNVWRAENTQKGRYREFIQCDADIIGSSSPTSDAEILKLVLDIYKILGLDVTIKINDRENFKDLDKKYVSAIDKLEKIGESEVLSELIGKGMTNEVAKKALSDLQKKPQTENINKILLALKQMGGDINKVTYEPTLARGLDYYTGIIFETLAKGSSGSLCSGGRFDKLIGIFSGNDISAVGLGLGFDRTIEALEEKNLLPSQESSSKVLVTILDNKDKSFEIYKKLRDENISCELYLNDGDKLEKQLKYADKKSLPYSIIVDGNNIALKDMKKREQENLSLKDIIKILSKT